MKTILVTGGNRGIGLEICRQLAGLGHQVILCSRDLQKGYVAAQNMRGEIIVQQLDVTDEESIQALFREISSRFGKLDALINNAGIGSAEWNRPLSSRLRDKIKRDFHGIWQIVRVVKPVLRWTGIAGKRENASNVNLQAVRQIMETNFYGPWRMIQVFIPLLQKSKDARIINVSSGLGELRSLKGEYPGYSLSKSSLNAMTIMFSNELRGKGIRVNALCPGWVMTDMGGPDARRPVSQGADTAVWLVTEEKIPTGKFFRDRQEIDW